MSQPISIHLNAVRVPGDPAKGQDAVIDVDVQEPGRLECLRRGECFFGVGYRPRFSADPHGLPVDRASRLDNSYWVVRIDDSHEAVFALQDPDGDGDYGWEKSGRAPFHGGNHGLGQRTHGNDIVLVVTEGAGDYFHVWQVRDGQQSNVLGPYKLAPNR